MKISKFWGIATFVILSFPGLAALKSIERYDLESPQGEVIVTPDQGRAVKIVNPGSTPSKVLLLTIPSPPLQSAQWQVSGRVKYQGVEGDAYLELMNYFPSGTFFSRTLAQSGTWKSLMGDSDWREFQLSFDARSGSEQKPTKLEFSLFMPGKGEVLVSGIELFEVDTSGQWWSDPQGGMVGAILGSTVGIIAATVGILTGLGKGRRIVLFLMVFTIGGGVILVAVGLTALGMGQPFGVWYPLALTGAVCTGVFGMNYRTAYLRFQQIELKKMSAQEQD